MKTSIVGAGHVGAATAHALVAAGLAADLVLASRNARRAEGHAMDLDHAGAILPCVTNVQGGGVELTEGSGVLILAHSIPPDRPGRDWLAAGNGRLFRETLPRLAALSPDAIVIVLSNPVDALTWLAAEVTGFAPGRVLGAGSLIDSARFRKRLAQRLQIHPEDIRAYVLGEHGQTQFPVVSLASAGGVRLKDHHALLNDFNDAVRAPFDVFERKGHTNFAIAQAAVMITRCVLRDERRTLPISTRVDDFWGVSDVCLSLPCVVGRGGVEKVLRPDFSEDEAAAFRRCAQAVRRGIETLG